MKLANQDQMLQRSMDLSGAAVVLDNKTYEEGFHDKNELYKAMRELCVNKSVEDGDLWREWEQLGRPVREDSRCICGVKIEYEYSMKNLINGEILKPIGSKCIQNAIGQGYKCKDCKKKFISEILRPAISRRLKENDWVCKECSETRQTLILTTKIKIAILERDDHPKFRGKKIFGISFFHCNEETYNYVKSLPKKWDIAELFIEYWEKKMKWKMRLEELEDRGY